MGLEIGTAVENSRDAFDCGSHYGLGGDDCAILVATGPTRICNKSVG
jgi:hypothetical protein